MEAGVIPCVVRLIANSDDAEMLAVAIVIIESSLSFHPSVCLCGCSFVHNSDTFRLCFDGLYVVINSLFRSFIGHYGS